MYLIQELFDWIAARTLLAPGVDLHCGYMPVETEGAVSVLLEQPGDPQQPTLRHNVGRYRFQVLTLGPTGSDFWAAYDRARIIFAVTNDVAGAVLGDGTYENEWYAEVMRAVSQPYYLGGDERFRHEISFDILLRARTAALMA